MAAAALVLLPWLAARAGAFHNVFGDSAAEADPLPGRWGRRGYCSWCFRPGLPDLLESNITTKDWYRCEHRDCLRGLHVCRLCNNYACWDKYGNVTQHDQLCADCNGTVDTFGRFEEDGDRCLDDVLEYPQLLGRRCLATAVVSPEIAAHRVVLGISLKTLMKNLQGVGCPRQYDSCLEAPLGSTASLLVVHMCHSFLDHPFRLLPQHSGNGDDSLTVITINGYTTQGKQDTNDWAQVLSASQYRSCRWLHLDWEAGSQELLKDVGMSLLKAAGELLQDWEGEELPPLLAAGVAAGVAGVAGVANHFARAKKRTKMVGYMLADILARCWDSRQRFVLLGHSLGGRIIFECLTHLLRSPRGMPVVEAHLLGAAATTAADAWEDIAEQTEVVNHYSSNDCILILPTLADGERAGRHPIQNPYVTNVDHSCDQTENKPIEGHTKWKVAGVL